jgi:phosphatidylglycerol---prolipoprotein diacylglyceryl transferase
MRFPTDPVALRAPRGRAGAADARARAGDRPAYETGLWDAVREQVPLRHPSQLYEALTEGLLLGLSSGRCTCGCAGAGRGRRRAPSAASSWSATARSAASWSCIRQPDAQFRTADDPLGTVLGPLTMGQTLSIFVILAGLLILFYAWSRRHRAREPWPVAERGRKRPDAGEAPPA